MNNDLCNLENEVVRLRQKLATTQTSNVYEMIKDSLELINSIREATIREVSIMEKSWKIESCIKENIKQENQMRLKKDLLSKCVDQIQDFKDRLDSSSEISTYGKFRELVHLVFTLAIACEYDENIEETINEQHDYVIALNLSDLQLEHVKQLLKNCEIDFDILVKE